MKLTIKNETIKIKGRKGVYGGTKNAGPVKTGFSLYDSQDRCVGVVYMADDDRKTSFGRAAILFNELFESENKRIWYMKEINGMHLSFDRLSEIMAENHSYDITIDL